MDILVLVVEEEVQHASDKSSLAGCESLSHRVVVVYPQYIGKIDKDDVDLVLWNQVGTRAPTRY